MDARHQRSRPVGVGKLMYVGDSDPCCYNRAAMTMCRVGTIAALAGVVMGNKKVRDVGAVVAIAGFIAL